MRPLHLSFVSLIPPYSSSQRYQASQNLLHYWIDFLPHMDRTMPRASLNETPLEFCLMTSRSFSLRLVMSMEKTFASTGTSSSSVDPSYTKRLAALVNSAPARLAVSSPPQTSSMATRRSPSGSPRRRMTVSLSIGQKRKSTSTVPLIL